MQIVIDTEKIGKFINNEVFINFLMTHTDISTSTFILQIIKNKIKEFESE